jgi:DNA-binding NtrC family response regulator
MMPVHAPSLVGCSAALRAAIDLARRFAPLFHPVLLVGPTGVGKSTLARLLHDWSGRAGDFVGVTGGELVDTLFHNQLFGHEKGSYTGATDQAPGAFERAAGGTLLLDELQHWSRDKQAAILAPLQDARVTRVGGRRALPITCRVVLASTIPLERLVHDDKLLPDLQYRIGDLVIELPPLVERRVDVAVLAYHFLDREREAGGATVPAMFDPAALERMLVHEWPGNVRELERVVQYAIVRAAGQERIRVNDLPSRVAAEPGDVAWDTLNDEERDALVVWALERVGGGRGHAANLLGLHANTIDKYRKHAAAAVASQATANPASRRVRRRVTAANRRNAKQIHRRTILTPSRGGGPRPCDIQPSSAPTPMSEAV